MEKIVIYGAGMIGTSERLVNFLQSTYEIVAYCDSDREKHGKVYHNCEVIDFKEMTDLINKKQIDMVVMAIAKQEIVDAVVHEIETKCDLEAVKIIGYKQFLIENKKKNFPKENYNKKYIDFSKNVITWLDNMTPHQAESYKGKINKKWISYREKYLQNLEFQAGATNFAPQTRNSIECRL